MPSNEPLISVRNLQVTYFPGKSNEVRALKEVSLEIFPGEFIVFFGPSGCGKSTLLYSISGLETKVSGDIVVKGNNLLTMNQKEREDFHQRTIGMIFQAFYLIPSLSVLENVTLPQVALNTSRRERTEKGLRLLSHFGVEQQAKKLPTELSGGQQQRVAICRSIMNDPDILLADEPVGNLDSKSSEEVMHLLRELNDRDKKTIILVSHDPSHLHHAHRVFFMRDGEIVRVQKNSEEDRRRSPVTSSAESSLKEKLVAWAKTLPTPTERTDDSMEDLLHVQEILIDVFADITLPDFSRLESAVMMLLRRGRGAKQALEELLTTPEERGGLGMQWRHARSLAKALEHETMEIRKLQSLARTQRKKAGAQAIPVLARSLCQYILREPKVHITVPVPFQIIERIVAERMRGTIDRTGVLTALHASQKKQGAGLPLRAARSLARRLETYILALNIPTATNMQQTSDTSQP